MTNHIQKVGTHMHIIGMISKGGTYLTSGWDSHSCRHHALDEVRPLLSNRPVSPKALTLPVYK